MTKHLLLLLLASLAVLPLTRESASPPPIPTISIGSIDYFGYQGIDLPRFAAQLPVHVGDPVTLDGFDRLKEKIQEAAKQITGKPATDIAGVCCDARHRLQIYIGLSGSSSRPLSLNPAPQGHDRLDTQAIQLYNREGAAWEDAVRRGAASEDDSNGYSLSHDPALRKIELAMRTYALSHQPELERVLSNAAEAQQRQASAALLGYAKRSTAQIRALTRATHDPDDDVRNNALRSLWVLASARQTGGIQVQPAPFIDFLFSGNWTDRNKSSLLLEQLTRRRDPALLKELRTSALAPLIEGARWTDPGHCDPFLAILGRIGRIPEPRLEKLIVAGDRAQIVQAAQHA